MLRTETCPFDLRLFDRQIRENEATARKDPRSYGNMLIDVHNNAIEHISRDIIELPLLFADVPRSSVRGDFDEFYERLNKFSGNLLTDLKDVPGLIVVGGSVLSALTGCSAGDIDIFLKMKSEEAKPTLIKIYDVIRANHSRVSKKRMLITRSKNAVTFYRVGANNTRLPPVQV